MGLYYITDRSTYFGDSVGCPKMCKYIWDTSFNSIFDGCVTISYLYANVIQIDTFFDTSKVTTSPHYNRSIKSTQMSIIEVSLLLFGFSA